MPLPVYSTDEIADQLVHDYWYDKNGGSWRAFDVGAGGTIEVNLTGLNATGTTLARAALEAWENVIDVQFAEVGSGGDLTFSHDTAGAIGGHSYSGNTINSAYVRIATSWFNNTNGNDIGSYSMQTFMHEIGHALGLGHAGDYDGGADYGINNHYLNDSWQMTVMSYFDQDENTWVDADKAVAATLMAADVVAAQGLYGASQAQAGNTIYGADSNVGGALEAIFDDAFNRRTGDTDNAFTLYDAGGIDRLNFEYETADQRIDLTPEAISDIGGLTGNLIIARGTIIEQAAGGSGSDEIIGNTAKNLLTGGGGNDTLSGGDGKDKLYGGVADDSLAGGDGKDILKGGWGHDTLDGGAISDNLYGQGGRDTLLGGSGGDVLWGGDDADLLKGEKGHDTLWGEDGDDILSGGGGKDSLEGGAGADRLWGGNGNDTLHGGAADDMLTGDYGADVFIFTNGQDLITDFENDTDTLWLDQALWGGGRSVEAVIDTYAQADAGDTFFDFGGGMSLRLSNLIDPDLLLDDLAFL
jgi:serralysin